MPIEISKTSETQAAELNTGFRRKPYQSFAEETKQKVLEQPFDAKPQLTDSDISELRAQPTEPEIAQQTSNRKAEVQQAQTTRADSQAVHDALNALGGVIDLQA